MTRLDDSSVSLFSSNGNSTPIRGVMSSLHILNNERSLPLRWHRSKMTRQELGSVREGTEGFSAFMDSSLATAAVRAMSSAPVSEREDVTIASTVTAESFMESAGWSPSSCGTIASR